MLDAEVALMDREVLSMRSLAQNLNATLVGIVEVRFVGLVHLCSVKGFKCH